MFNNFEEPYTVEAHVSRVSTEDLAHAIETMPAHAVGSPLHLAAVAELAARTAPVEPATWDTDEYGTMTTRDAKEFDTARAQHASCITEDGRMGARLYCHSHNLAIEYVG